MDDRLALLLPYPVTVRRRPGWLDLGAEPAIVATPDTAHVAAVVRDALAALPWPVRRNSRPGRQGQTYQSGQPGRYGEHSGQAESGCEPGNGPQVNVAVAPDLPEEGYRLSIRPDQIEIAAGGAAGAFYAVQTLRQLLPDEAWRSAPVPGPAWTVPCAEIEDAPALSWRGAHLDVSRHFFTKREVLSFVDALAAHKLNRLHLHLTDDQGWRIESRAHPQLHEIGSHRSRTRISLNREEPSVYEEIPYGGYYTLADLAEIAAYAAEHMVTVIPEIEIPGHASALLAAMPELGSAPGEQYRVQSDWGIFPHLMSPLPATLAFLEEIFGELLDAIPARYVHLGGDECALDSWRANPKIEAYRQELGLADADELHAWMLRQVADMLARKFGARAVVWDEGFASAEGRPDGPGALRQDTIVMAWRGMDIGRRAAEAGHDVIAVPVLPTYLDYAQSDEVSEPVAIGGPIRVEDVAAFCPVDRSWPEDARRRVIGTQFQLWTEYIRDWRSLEYMAFPRGCALAEVAWSGSSAGWTRSAAAPLRERVAAQLRRLDAAGIEYRPLDGPRPWQQGGSGPRRHRPGYPVAEVAVHLAQAAAGPATR